MEMKETKKLSQLLKTDCGQCSSCCRNIQVDVTDTDIERLVEHTGLPADKLVRLYSDIDSEAETDWIKLSYGNRAMGLNKKPNGDCIFLSEDKTCMAYEARPMTCRIFPVCVVLNKKDEIVDLEISEVISDKTINCKRTRGNGRSYSSFMSTATQSMSEDEVFKKKVDQWNSLSVKGLKNDFLNFLGFETSKNSRGNN